MLGGEGNRRGWLLAASLSLLAAPWLGGPGLGGLYSLLLGTQDSDLLGPLSRAREVVELELALDSIPLKGACYLGEPLLSQLSPQACRPAPCIWSEKAQCKVPIVTSSSSTGPVRAAAAANASIPCLQPTGGQLTPQQGQQPQVSLVFVDRNNSLAASHSFLELFLSAAEAPSVEFLLVSVGDPARGSGEGGTTGRPVIQVAQRLQHLFGVQMTFLVAPDLGSAHTLGIEAAHGQIVALVDSRMLVIRGWLGAVLATLSTSPRAAAVAPLTLTSAAAAHHVGGLVDASGLATLHGRGQRLSADMYFRREVDFAPLECLVVNREALKEVWGVDDHFLTQRYKAADLGMALRSAGFQVLLQPLALVLAPAGQQQGAGGSGAGSAGTAGLEALAPADEQHDRARLRDKWGTMLQLKHCPPGTDAFTASSRHARPRLLWVDDTPPQPDKDSGSIRSLNMLQVLLDEGYHVSMLTTHSATHARYPAQARSLGVRLLPKMDPSQWPVARNGRCDFDVILVARRDVYLAAEAVLNRHCPGVPKVYDTVDLHFLREARDMLTAGPEGGMQGSQHGWEMVANLSISRIAEWLDSGAAQAAEPRKARDVELRLVDASALTVVVSYEEVDLIQRYRPQVQVAVVSNVHLVEGPPKTSCHGRSGMLFVGNMNHLPNRQALETLVLDVLPRLLRLLPWRERWRLRLHVVASGMVPKPLLSLLRQQSAHVVFHGYLPDDELYVLYNTSMVAVAPLLSGAGVKGKVNQAMKLGVPVVATPIAIEGTGAQDGRECLVASDPAGFAARVAQVYTDCGLWGRLADAGYRNVQRHFSREMGGPALLQALNRIGVGPFHDFHRDTCQSQGRRPGSSIRT